MEPSFFGLCNPGSDEAGVYLDCTSFEAWLGSLAAHLVIFGLALWAAFIVIRLLYLAHSFKLSKELDSLWRQSVSEKSFDMVTNKHAEDIKALRHDLDVLTNRITNMATNMSTAKRDDQLRADLNNLSTAVDQLRDDFKQTVYHLGDPDAVVSEAVPCKRGKFGRWLEAWVPFGS